MNWVTVRVRATRQRDSIVILLISEGASCIQEEGDALVTSFPEDAVPRNLQSRISKLDFDARVEITQMPEQTYELHGTVTARRIGDLFVVPPWDSASYPPERTVIIEPGGAFGTGDHETTRGVLELLQKVGCKGSVVADLGAGSAVLSIAAAKLGASRVAAIELDHDAIANAEDNVAANAVADVVTVIEGDATTILPLLAPVDLILANIISGVIIELLPLMWASLREEGMLIVSGILESELRDVVEALFGSKRRVRVADQGWTVEDEYQEGEWFSLLIRRR